MLAGHCLRSQRGGEQRQKGKQVSITGVVLAGTALCRCENEQIVHEGNTGLACAAGINRSDNNAVDLDRPSFRATEVAIEVKFNLRRATAGGRDVGCRALCAAVREVKKKLTLCQRFHWANYVTEHCRWNEYQHGALTKNSRPSPVCC